jgi:methyl-accepting chemotaxis protein
MRSMRGPALVLGLVLLSSAVGLTWQETQSARDAAGNQNTELRTATANTEVLLTEEFERAGAIGLLTAQDAVLTDFFGERGSTASKVEADGPGRQKIVDLLAYVQTLFPGSVARSGYVDAVTGQEIAEVVNGASSPPITLDPNGDKHLPFFGDVMSLPTGWLYQSTPYFSEETNEWVIANGTSVVVDGETRGVLYFELRLEALRAQVLEREGNATMRAITARNGMVAIDSRMTQVSEDTFGQTDDTTFVGATSSFGLSGLTTIHGDRVAYVRMTPSETLQIVNRNDWFITASEPAVVTGLGATVSPLLIALLALALPLLAYATWSYVRLSRRNKVLRREAEAERDRLNARIGDLSSALDQAANGNLAVTLPVDFDDEQLTALAHSFESTLHRLRLLVSQAQGHGVQLAQAAGQMRATAQEQAGSATEQSAVVAQTTATIEELAATAAQIAETAGSVARVASETLALTDEGRAAVAESVEAMESLRSVVDQVSSSSAGLGDKIGEVGRILVLIDELSEQTNLLALNAAIEAARAGEHGRGFAVVAAEVRKLAERAQESTSQIQGIVTEIQAHTRSTVVASEQGAKAAERGASKAAGAVVALDRIAAMVDEATGAAEEISIATQQQRSASDQVVVAMTQVSEVSRQYATGSKQTAAASAQIATLAAVMQDSISTFRVDADANELSMDGSDHSEAEVVWPGLDEADDLEELHHGIEVESTDEPWEGDDGLTGAQPPADDADDDTFDDAVDGAGGGTSADEGLTV